MKIHLTPLLSFVAITGLILIASCSKDKDSKPSTQPPANQTTITTTGDAQTLVASDNKVAIAIPAGAIAAGTDVKITVNPTVAPGGIGTTYTLEPSGLTFSSPVTLAFLGTEDVNSTIVAAAYREGSGAWTKVTDVMLDRTTYTVTVQTTHFSEWTLIESEGFLIIDQDDSVHTFPNVRMATLMDTTTIFSQDTVVNISLPNFLIDHPGQYDKSHYMDLSLRPGWEIYTLDADTLNNIPTLATFTQKVETVDGEEYRSGTFRVPTNHSVYHFNEGWKRREDVIRGVYRLKK